MIWSLVLAALGIAGLYLAGSRKAYGWLLGVLAQVLWLIYGLTTEQYGFIVSAFAYGYVYARNYGKWRKEDGRRLEGQDVNPG